MKLNAHLGQYTRKYVLVILLTIMPCVKLPAVPVGNPITDYFPYHRLELGNVQALPVKAAKERYREIDVLGPRLLVSLFSTALVPVHFL